MKIACSHCHIKFDKSVLIEQDDLFFCCKGCQGVYGLLHDSGLGSFYDKLGSRTIQAPINTSSDAKKFDTQSFHKRYVKSLHDDLFEVDLMIEGIHCAACVWLNEKVLYDTDGIVQADINFSNNKAKIVWQKDKIVLSSIIEKIRQIGYDAYAYDLDEVEKKAVKEKKEYYLKLVVAVFGSLNIMMIGIAKYTGFFTGMDKEILSAVHVAEFILATPVLFFSGSVFFKGAYFNIKNRNIGMDTLVATGATLTYIFSVYVMLGGSGYSYFDSVVMIITFVLVGKYLEKIGKKNAVDIVDKMRATIPVDCEIIQNNKIVSKLIDEIQVGDIVLLKPGQKAPVDGIVLEGSGSFDESSISGESMPIIKNKTNQIISGTILEDSTIKYKATTNFAHSTTNEIIKTIENSLASKPAIQKKANQLSKYFSVSILSVALLTFIWWFFVGGFEIALITAISVIVIACPCALALSTPMAVVVGISKLAKLKVLFKEAKYLEILSKATTVVLDKTGTLTNGKLSVVKQTIYDDKYTQAIKAIVSASTHPVSKAVYNYINNDNKTTADINNIKQNSGQGFSAIYKEQNMIAGSIDYLETFGIFVNTNSSHTIFCVAVDEKLVAVYELSDELKENSQKLIEYLNTQNINIVMLSGDRQIVVDKVAKKLKIKKRYANMSPKDKANFITKLKQNQEIVVMIGDGINDAVALSKADISISMASGSDISVKLSDIIILDNSINKIIQCFKVSKLTYRQIKQNLGLSLIYNMATIPVAVMGYVIPLVAALSMSLSSLIVVANSLRIKNTKDKI